MCVINTLCCNRSINGYYDHVGLFRDNRDALQDSCPTRVGATMNTLSVSLFFRSPQAITQPMIFHLVRNFDGATFFDHHTECVYAGAYNFPPNPLKNP